MKTKNFVLFIESALILILMLNLVSATISFANVPTLKQDGSSATITIKSTVDEAITLVINPITQNSKEITFNYPLSIAAGEWGPDGVNYKKDITITPNIPAGFEFILGEKTYSTNLIVKNTLNETLATRALSFEETEFCDYGDSGKLEIKIRDVNNKGFGEDSKWYPFDEIEVEIRVNSNSYDIENIEVEWALYNPQGEKVIDGSEKKDFDLDKGDKETIIITFKLDEDVDELEDDTYTLFVRATGEINDKNSAENGENTCISDSNTIDIVIEKDFVVLDDVDFSLDTVQCGAEIQISADAWNIGSRDQDGMIVGIYSKFLEKELFTEIGDIDSLEKEKLNFALKIPENAKEGDYTIELRVYDEDNNIYENDEDKKAIFYKQLKIDGGCGVLQKSAIISAILESDAKAGKDLIIKTTITNSGENLETFSLNAANYADWASSAKFDQDTFVLGAGESKTALLTLAVKNSAEGEQLFNIKVLSKGELIKTQPVSVTIQKSGFSFGITGGVINEQNWYLWGIGALNIILVIIIIIVAIRIARS